MASVLNIGSIDDTTDIEMTTHDPFIPASSSKASRMRKQHNNKTPYELVRENGGESGVDDGDDDYDDEDDDDNNMDHNYTPTHSKKSSGSSPLLIFVAILLCVLIGSVWYLIALEKELHTTPTQMVPEAYENYLKNKYHFEYIPQPSKSSPSGTAPNGKSAGGAITDEELDKEKKDNNEQNNKNDDNKNNNNNNKNKNNHADHGDHDHDEFLDDLLQNEPEIPFMTAHFYNKAQTPVDLKTTKFYKYLETLNTNTKATQLAQSQALMVPHTPYNGKFVQEEEEQYNVYSYLHDLLDVFQHKSTTPKMVFNAFTVPTIVTKDAKKGMATCKGQSRDSLYGTRLVFDYDHAVLKNQHTAATPKQRTDNHKAESKASPFVSSFVLDQPPNTPAAVQKTAAGNGDLLQHQFAKITPQLFHDMESIRNEFVDPAAGEHTKQHIGAAFVGKPIEFDNKFVGSFNTAVMPVPTNYNHFRYVVTKRIHIATPPKVQEKCLSFGHATIGTCFSDFFPKSVANTFQLFDQQDLVDITVIPDYWQQRAKWFGYQSYAEMPFHPELPLTPLNTGVENDEWVMRCVTPWEIHPEYTALQADAAYLAARRRDWNTGPEDSRLYWTECGDLVMIYAEVNDLNERSAFSNRVLNINVLQLNVPFSALPQCGRKDYEGFQQPYYTGSEREGTMATRYEKNWGILTHGFGTSFDFRLAHVLQKVLYAKVAQKKAEEKEKDKDKVTDPTTTTTPPHLLTPLHDYYNPLQNTIELTEAEFAEFQQQYSAPEQKEQEKPLMFMRGTNPLYLSYNQHDLRADPGNLVGQCVQSNGIRISGEVHLAANNVLIRVGEVDKTNNFIYALIVQGKTGSVYTPFMFFFNALTMHPVGFHRLDYGALVQHGLPTGSYFYSHALWANETPLSLKVVHPDNKYHPHKDEKKKAKYHHHHKDTFVLHSYYNLESQFFININTQDTFTRLQQVDMKKLWANKHNCGVGADGLSFKHTTLN